MLYDPYAEHMQVDPYPVYQHFRENEPCAYNPNMDFYALFRFEDVWQATLDWETYSSSLGPILENRGEVPGELMSIIGMDPPRHTRLRNLVSRGFTPRRIGEMEKQVRDIARGYLEPYSQRHSPESKVGSFDIQQEFSVKFPMDVISVLLGIPEPDRDQYRQWVDQGLERDPDTGESPPENLAAMGKASALLLELLGERRERPQDDLITVIAEARYTEADGSTRPLTDMEIVSFCGLLAAAGAETTAKLIGNAIVYLARHPEQRQMLWDDPGKIAGGIEEILRYDAPSQFQGRVALEDATVHGVTIPKGARVALVTAAACRDPREFEDPDRLDVTRTPGRQLYFGHGHHCRGSGAGGMPGHHRRSRRRHGQARPCHPGRNLGRTTVRAYHDAVFPADDGDDCGDQISLVTRCSRRHHPAGEK
jgi:cytochrome P450